MFDPASVKFRGPLKAYVDGFWSELLRRGYAPLSARNLLYVAAHLSRWLEDASLQPGELTSERVEAFLADRRRSGYRHFCSLRGLGPVLSYVRDLGVVPAAVSPAVETPVDRLLGEYAEYLIGERGLRSATVRAYRDFARQFIAARRPPGWDGLTASEITTFVLGDGGEFGVGYRKSRVTMLRSLLRFLHVRGLVTHDLASCVPAVASWRLASLPKALETDQVDRLVKAGDVGSAVGRRDVAIVSLLLRLGLRACEVGALRLDDVDWRTGEIRVRGKGSHESRLPLPADVGRALVAYLRDGRPSATSRHVFLRGRAPYKELATSGVIAVAARALRRAGILVGGAHVLRHTAATQMLRRGASLSDIAHVLRHRHVDTTAIYAKVDHTALRTLAKPWPGGAA